MRGSLGFCHGAIASLRHVQVTFAMRWGYISGNGHFAVGIQRWVRALCSGDSSVGMGPLQWGYIGGNRNFAVGKHRWVRALCGGDTSVGMGTLQWGYIGGNGNFGFLISAHLTHKHCPRASPLFSSTAALSCCSSAPGIRNCDSGSVGFLVFVCFVLT